MKVIPNWELLVTSRLSGGKEIGPALESLPEELLPALSKFLFIGKDEIEQVRILCSHLLKDINTDFWLVES